MGRHLGEDWGEDYPHRDATEAIILAAIRVQKALGPGLLEDAYKVSLAHAIRPLAGIRAAALAAPPGMTDPAPGSIVAFLS